MLLEVLRRDFELGGSLLAGALAFRLYVWLLPCSLLMTAVLGFTVSSRHGVDERTFEGGLGPFTATALNQIASQAERGRYLSGAIGLVLLAIAGLSLGRALDRVHNRIWQDVLDPRIRPTLYRGARYTVVLLLILIDNIVTPFFAVTRGMSVFLIAVPNFVLHTVLAVVLFGGDWPPRWRRDLPGAVLMAVGVACLHLVSVLYLPHQLARASYLYGTLGVAATMLVWLALLARLMVLGQVLNATRQQAPGVKRSA